MSLTTGALSEWFAPYISTGTARRSSYVLGMVGIYVRTLTPHQNTLRRLRTDLQGLYYCVTFRTLHLSQNSMFPNTRLLSCFLDT
jgi:hypothetical protein